MSGNLPTPVFEAEMPDRKRRVTVMFTKYYQPFSGK
nr:MAG TPA: hypothetical protein [Caudoviricetes sp.]